MWNLKTSITLLCLCTIAVNPVVAVAMPCCCTKQVEVKSSCCHAKAKSAAQSKSNAKVCCTRPSTPTRVTAERCGCCVKSIPQTTPTRDVSVTVTGVEFASALWSTDTVILTAVDHLRLREIEGPFSLTGPRLLALYCKWLE